MDAYTPPPSPSQRLAPQQRDRTRSRRTASPRLKIRHRSFGERPSTPTQRPASPDFIFSMSPIDSHIPPTAPSSITPKTQLNPGALLARARHQSASAFAALKKPRQQPPLLYTFPKSAAHLRAPPTTGTTRVDSHPARFSPINESSDDTGPSPAPAASKRGRAAPITVPLPIPIPRTLSSFDSAQFSPESFYGSSDAEADDSAAAPPPKIVGFDTGIDSDADSSDEGPFRLERFIAGTDANLESRTGVRGRVLPLQDRNRS